VLSFAVVSAKPQSGTQSSPLIDALYQASRQKNEKEATPFPEQAQQLLSQGADARAIGSERRTPLHWAAIGAMSVKNEAQVRVYLDLVQQLIANGADVNAEDEFGATPLDYQENSPTTSELTFVLIDSGARNGSGQSDATRLEALLQSLTSASDAGDLGLIRSALAFDLPVGTQLQVRLTTDVNSHTSRAGDVIEAVVVAPVMVDERVALAPRTRVRGTVMLSQRAANDYERAQLILNFATLILQDGSKTQVVTRLVEVDNAREAASLAAAPRWKEPDVVYQKQTDTFAKRHHVRIWQASTTFDGSDVWIAAATHDMGVAVQKGGRQWFHRIDPQVDRERSKVTNDLAFAGAVTSLVLVERPNAPRDAKNATGDKIVTDGKMAVVFLR
jgi:hypothetical protein